MQTVPTIAIGEMVFTSGSAITAAHLSFITVVLGNVTMAEIISLWALTFGRFYNLVADHLEETRDPMRAGNYAINALVIILFGLVAVSVANKQIILHPYEMPSPVLSFLLGGGPILFLVAQGCYLVTVPNVIPRLYVISVFLLLLVSVGSCLFPAWVSLTIIGLILTVLAILDSQ